MRRVRFHYQGSVSFGTREGDAVRVIEAATFAEALKTPPSGAAIPVEAVTLLNPVARPGKILAIALNYAAHAAESISFTKTDAGGVQKWFNKQATAINDPYADVHLPRVSNELDYEGELVAVIGQSGRHVPEERALDIVAGLTVGCDYSVRDWQRASPTMMMGKGFDTHAPVGPELVTLDETGAIGARSLRTYVNGEMRQEASLETMLHSLPQQIAHLTAAFTLEPGDMIFTGTPAGVGAAFDPPKWLKAGDVVRVEIDDLGYIENRIVPEPDDTQIY